MLADLSHDARPNVGEVPSPARIAVMFSPHSLQQAQRRGISTRSLSLVLTHHDRSQKVPGLCRALWVSPKRRKSLVQSGVPAADVDRLAGVRLIISLRDDEVVTVEHAIARRHWA